MAWNNLKNLFVSIFVIFVLVCNMDCAFAIEEVGNKLPTVVVLSDSNHRHGTTYLICGAASDIFASDIVNRLNQSGRVKAPLLGESMSQVTKNIPLYTNTFFKEYKYNYNVDFVNLKRVTRNMQADYILMVTSGMDIQSQLFKETWWNKWGISSSQPLTPTYILATMITLIDNRTYDVVWQEMYQREIKAENMDLGITQFSPNYPQLAKIKKYSATMSEYVANNVVKVAAPTKQSNTEPKLIEMQGRFVNEGTKIYYPTVNGQVVKQNFDEVKQNIGDFASEQKIRWQKNKKQKQQRQLIEKQSKQTQINKQDTNNNTERLFDSIRNNIEDVSNSLPEPRQKQESKMVPVDVENLKPAVEIKKEHALDSKKNVKFIQERKQIQNINENKAPSVNPEKDFQNNISKPQEQIKQQKPINYDTPENHVPRYDWNLKNIYLQKIGLSNL